MNGQLLSADSVVQQTTGRGTLNIPRIQWGTNP